MKMESISTPQVVDQYHDPDDNLNEINESIGNIEETDATEEPLEGLSLSSVTIKSLKINVNVFLFSFSGPENSSQINPGVVIKTEERRYSPIGDTFDSVAHVPKVKLEISSGPNPPVQNFKPLPYGRRKRNWSGPRVKLVLSAKRIHLPTKANNILLESSSESQESSNQAAEPAPKYRRKQRNLSYQEVPLSLTPKESILDAFNEAYEDNDDGFTTIKDLAEREITKIEPLDYDDYYDYGFDDDTGDVKNESFDAIEYNVKEEPQDYSYAQDDLDFVEFDEDAKLSLMKKPTTKTRKPR